MSPTIVNKTVTAPPQPPNVMELIARGVVVSVGELATMSREQFADVIETLGGRYSSNSMGVGRGVSLVVIGQRSWPLTRSGQVWQYLRDARVKKLRDGYRFTVLSERLFLEGIGRHADAEGTHRLYTISTITELLDVTRNQVRAWVRAGLVEPVRVDGGVWYFDFRQVSAAGTIADLLSRGVSAGALRRHLKRFQGWLPDVDQPLAQLAIIEAGGPMLLRLAKGELLAGDGQLHFDFQAERETNTNADDAFVPLRLTIGPSSAAEWHELGIEQEQEGYLLEAVESYRQALLTGGPDSRVVFDLAHALQQLARHEEAIERYRQAVEMHPAFDDAWNNLGVLLAQQDRHQDACEAFRRAIGANPRNFMAHYNLADTLDELGRWDMAAPHWRAYLMADQMSDRAAYARRRLA